jgi:ComEC/Rec2-related protein
MLQNINNMKKPMIYYAISIFIGCLSALMLCQSVIVGAVITASFFTIFFFTMDKKFFVINMIFFLMGMLSFTMYFNLKVSNHIEIRVLDKKGYYYQGDYKGRKLILSGKISDIKEGEKLKVYGKFESGKDYSRGIIGKYNIEKYTKCKNDFIYYLYDVKRNIYLQFKGILGEEKSAIIMALCYGDTGYLSKSQKSEFQQLGVVHAVSVSGFHMAVIFKVLESLIGLKFSIATCFIYILFTGIQASTIRAFIMIFIFKFSKVVFKNYDSMSSLSFSALILLLIKPYYIIDIGFMLSFLATIGILLYYKKMLRVLYKLPEKMGESLSITLSSQIFSIPYVAFTIQSFSGGFILGNILLLPMYSAIVILGNIALLVCSIKPVFQLLNLGLNFILTAVEGANYLILKVCPAVSLLGYLDGIALILIYMSFLFYSHGYKKVKYLPAFVSIMMLCSNYSFVPQVHYIQFFKGEAIVIKYKMDSTMICNYDSSSAKNVMNLKEEMGVNKIITNPQKSSVIRLDSGLYVKIIPYHVNECINIDLFNGDRNFMFIDNGVKKDDIAVFNADRLMKFPPHNMLDNSSKNTDYTNENKYNLYVIMFNRIINIY